MIVGLIGSIPAAVTGFADYASLEEGDPAEKTATRHMVLMMAAVSIYVGSVIVRRGPSAPSGGWLLLVLTLEAIGALLLFIGAHHGGSLVYDLGVGRHRG